MALFCCSSNEIYYEYYNFNEDIINITSSSETHSIDFADKKDSSFLLSGWSHTENVATWATGKKSEIIFNTFHPDVDKKMTILCIPFYALSRQSIEIYLNGHFLRKITLEVKPKPQFGSFEIILPAEFQTKYQNKMEFVFESTGSPKKGVLMT